MPSAPDMTTYDIYLDTGIHKLQIKNFVNRPNKIQVNIKLLKYFLSWLLEALHYKNTRTCGEFNLAFNEFEKEFENCFEKEFRDEWRWKDTSKIRWFHLLFD